MYPDAIFVLFAKWSDVFVVNQQYDLICCKSRLGFGRFLLEVGKYVLMMHSNFDESMHLISFKKLLCKDDVNKVRIQYL